jgi:uncharacterized cofD-like protein
VPGIKEALLSNTRAIKIYVCNIMTQPGETDNFTVSDHLRVIFRHTGAKVVDYVIANNKDIMPEVLVRYAQENSYPVRVDRDEIQKLGVKFVGGKLYKDGEYIRHADDVLGKMIMKLVII